MHVRLKQLLSNQPFHKSMYGYMYRKYTSDLWLWFISFIYFLYIYIYIYFYIFIYLWTINLTIEALDFHGCRTNKQEIDVLSKRISILSDTDPETVEEPGKIGTGIFHFSYEVQELAHENACECDTEGPSDNGSDTPATAESTSSGARIAVAILFICSQ